MNLLINILLLTCGFLGALAAFGGETWRKTDEPLLKRITNRGWLSLGCLVLALIIGVVKELKSSITSQEEATNRDKLEQQLRSTSEQLQATEQDLRTANTKISEMELRVREMAPQVASIPRQVYSIGQGFEPSESRPLRQQLHGGDTVEYDGDCKQLYLIVGGSVYHLDPNRPRRIVVGSPGVPMTAVIENRSSRPCRSKMNILSVARR